MAWMMARGVWISVVRDRDNFQFDATVVCADEDQSITQPDRLDRIDNE